MKFVIIFFNKSNIQAVKNINKYFYGKKKLEKAVTFYQNVHDATLRSNIIIIFVLSHQMSFSKRIGKYKIDLKEYLGNGAGGYVYKCRDQKQQQLAIKIMPFKQKDDLQKELRQIHIARQKDIILSMDHKNLVMAHDYIRTEHNHYIIMELCEKTLREIIKENKKDNKFIEEAAALDILKQILAGYKMLYNRGVIHRDLKPENILISKDVVKIGDFGISKISDICTSEEHTLAIGTESYSALELFLKKYNYKCDLWSIGIIFYELLHNKRPFNCTLPDLKKKRPKIQYRENLSKEVIDLIQKLLSVDPEERIDFQELLKHPIFKQYFKSNAESFAELIMRQLSKSIKINQFLCKEVKILLTKQEIMKKKMCFEEFKSFMSEISEFMDETKTKIVFEEYKDINEKVSVLTIRKLFGIMPEGSIQKIREQQIILTKSQSDSR